MATVRTRLIAITERLGDLILEISTNTPPSQQSRDLGSRADSSHVEHYGQPLGQRNDLIWRRWTWIVSIPLSDFRELN